MAHVATKIDRKLKTPLQVVRTVVADTATLSSPAPYLSQLQDALADAKNSLCGSVYPPRELRSLTYAAEPFTRLRSENSKYNFPKLLLEKAESFWELLSQSLEYDQMPEVIPGDDDFVVFAWVSPKRRLEINFFSENEDCVKHDWVMQIGEEKPTVGPVMYSPESLISQVRDFASANN